MSRSEVDLDRKAEELAGSHESTCTALRLEPSRHPIQIGGSGQFNKRRNGPCNCSRLERLALIRATLGEMQKEIERLKDSSQAMYQRGHGFLDRALAAEAKCAELEKRVDRDSLFPVRMTEEDFRAHAAQAHERGRAEVIAALATEAGRAGLALMQGWPLPEERIAWQRATEAARVEGIEAAADWHDDEAARHPPASTPRRFHWDSSNAIRALLAPSTPPEAK